MPLKKTSVFKNSSLSCNKTGVLFIGENPKAGKPTSLTYLLSVPPGKIRLVNFKPLRMLEFVFVSKFHDRTTYNSSVVSLNTIQKGFESSRFVTGTLGCFCSYSIQIPSPASLHQRFIVASHSLWSTVTGNRQSNTTTSSGGTTFDCTPP